MSTLPKGLAVGSVSGVVFRHLRFQPDNTTLLGRRRGVKVDHHSHPQT